MAEDTSSQSSEKAWFADMNWRTNAILAILAIVFGGGGGFFGGNLKTTAKETAPAGITQDQADVRYLQITAADKRGEKGDQKLDRIDQKIDENQKKNESEQKEIRNLLMEILQNQKASK